MSVAQPAPPAMTELRRAARAARPEGLLDLSRSEPLPVPPSAACAERVAEQFMRSQQYSPPAGLMPVREAAARYASARTGLDLDAGRVAITAGAMAGLAVALRTLTEPGDEVLVPVPYFHSYPKQVAMLGGVPRLVDTRPERGELTPEAVAREVTPRTRALLLCNPANPAGVLLDRERIAAILAALPPRVAVIADEVYAEYVYDADFISALAVAADEDAGRVVVALDTASKTAAMPGWRVGTAVGTEGLAPRLGQAAATLSGAPSTLAQLAFAAWLDDPPAGDRMAPYRPRLRDVLDALDGSGLTVRPPAGSYYVWVTGSEGLGSADTALHLAQRTGVLVWPGVLFGDLRSVRVSLGVPRRDLRNGVIRFTDSWREVREGDISFSGSGR
jgi:aspartate/methionine/tyrosine aminotransferase